MWARAATAASILILVIGIIYGAKSPVTTAFAAESHKSIGPTFVLILNLAHDVDFPAVSFEYSQFRVNSGGWRLHDDRVENRSRARFPHLQILPHNKERVSTLLVRSDANWQSRFAEIDSIIAFDDCGLAATHIYDDKPSFNFFAMIKEQSVQPYVFTRIDNQNVTYPQSGAMGYEKLKASDGMLFLLNICLKTSDKHLLLGRVYGLLGELNLLIGTLSQPEGSSVQLGRCAPQEDRGDSEHNREYGHDALVVAFNEVVRTSQEDQRSLEERGAGLLVIILAGVVVLLWTYNAGSESG